MMKAIYAYLRVFEILNEYWRETENSDLGSMLSGMNPDPLYDTPYLSADPGAYVDWSTAWDEIVGRGKDGSEEQVLRVAESFIGYYTDTVGYRLGDAESFLKARLGLKESKFAAVG